MKIAKKITSSPTNLVRLALLFHAAFLGLDAASTLASLLAGEPVDRDSTVGWLLALNALMLMVIMKISSAIDLMSSARSDIGGSSQVGLFGDNQHTRETSPHLSDGTAHD